MSSSVVIAPREGKRSFDKVVGIYWKEAKYEFLKYWRMPVYSLSVILFPAMFYTLFGLILNRDLSGGHKEAATYLLATMGCYGVIGVALFGFGVGVAMERGQGWLQVKRASPMPVAAYFTGRVAMCLIFSLIVFLMLFTLGSLFGGVHLTGLQVMALMATLVLGSIPFCSFGLAIGYFARPNSAPSIVNMLYLPLSFFSGLWMPIGVFPTVLQKVAVALPPYHLGQLALHMVGFPGRGDVHTHINVLIGFALICLGAAMLGFRRDEGKLYG
ncbi:ABC transporter permease protein [Acidisarcina polymorpha]|uniref:ABC transporter permease protein n=1 Tax=Acidisarcina polymorpha TaxID=2211140 RepID=A0A2Z5FY43_9BACT|nr:ABC transporter permease [Acidisarcina polymorpha]AXC11434.1 ABC transporter permease protein [Acidisarcina polymorpha]